MMLVREGPQLGSVAPRSDTGQALAVQLGRPPHGIAQRGEDSSIQTPVGFFFQRHQSTCFSWPKQSLPCYSLICSHKLTDTRTHTRTHTCTHRHMFFCSFLKRNQQQASPTLNAGQERVAFFSWDAPRCASKRKLHASLAVSPLSLPPPLQP